MRLVILFSILVTVFTLVTCYMVHKDYSYKHDLIFMIQVAFTILVIFIWICLVIMIPIFKYDCKEKVERFKSATETIEQQKETATDLERVQLSNQIIEYNTWLKSEQYQCKNKWLGIYSDDSVLELIPIK